MYKMMYIYFEWHSRAIFVKKLIKTWWHIFEDFAQISYDLRADTQKYIKKVIKYKIVSCFSINFGSLDVQSDVQFFGIFKT